MPADYMGAPETVQASLDSQRPRTPDLAAMNACFRRRAVAALLFLGIFALPRASSAGELAAFAAWGRPGEAWGMGFGGSFTLYFFNIVGVELEGARQPIAVGDARMITISGRALVAPSSGRFVPYGGLSIGGYNQSSGSNLIQYDWGTLSGAFLGLKLKLPAGLIAKGEYDWIHLSGQPLIPMDARYSLAAGISF